MRGTDLEATFAGYNEVVQLPRMFGRPDYFLRAAVADRLAYDAFLTGRLIWAARCPAGADRT